MRVRPWPLVVLAVMQILTPAVSLLMNSWLLKVPLAYVWMMSLHGSLERTATLWLAMPIAGIAIFAVKPWSYPVFMTALGITVGYNFKVLKIQGGSTPVGLVVLLGISNALLVTYFLLPAVMKVYFDKRLRWWEGRPRFETAFDCTLTQSGTVKVLQAQVINWARGGLFVKTSDRLDTTQEVRARFRFFAQEFDLTGEIRHTTRGGYGIQWKDLPGSTRRQLSRIESGLLFLGISSSRVPSRFEDFLQWLQRLVQERKGWLPELPPRSVTK